MGRIVHFEIPGTEPEKLTGFYQKIFGWKAEKWGDQDYWLLETGPTEKMGINGAIAPRGGQLKNVVNTIHVTNLEESMKKINANGGKILTEIMDIPNVGLFVYFADPDQNVMGLLQGNME